PAGPVCVVVRPAALRSTSPMMCSSEPRNDVLGESAHRCRDLIVAEITEAHLAQNMTAAGIAHGGDLLGNVFGAADQGAGRERELQALLIGEMRVRPGIQQRGVNTEIARIEAFARM